MVPRFHETHRGQVFFEHHIPQIAKSLQGIEAQLKRANDLKEKELNHHDNSNEKKILDR